jgi:uncharacterized protein (TIGR00369 family)
MSSHPGLAGLVPFGTNTGYHAYVGTIYHDASAAPGEARRFAFMPEAKHLNGGGNIHGGVLMSLVDTILGFTAQGGTATKATATVTLNTDFLSGGAPGEIVWGTAHVTRATRSLIFVAGELTQGKKTLMTASGIWKVLGA